MADRLTDDLASLKIDRGADAERPRPMRALVLAAAAVAACVAVVLLAGPRITSRIFKTEVAATEVALISPAQASIAFTSTGYVVPQTISRVGARVPGRIARLAVKEGDVVKAGDTLATLEDADQRSAILTASSRVLAAQARAQTARANLAEVGLHIAREQPLVAQNVAPRATLEDLQARHAALEETVKAADAEVRAVQSELEMLRTNLANMTVTAPIDGTVITKPASQGELVGPQVGSVVEIADMASLVVETDVPEGRLHMARAGGFCEIVLDAFPSERHRGRVQSIGKRVNRAKGTVTVRVAFVEPVDAALPDMSARVGFLTAELSVQAMKEPPKVVVPSAAITERGGRKVVLVIDGGKVRETPVRIGAAVGPAFELVDGPAPGTRLVANPPSWLEDGQRIKERND
ncbi:MAG: efflux RND transporter periplasmic adaptor subunit [Myxococcota bacterium]